MSNTVIVTIEQTPGYRMGGIAVIFGGRQSGATNMG